MSNSLLLYVGYRLIDFFIDALERITIISPPNGEILQQKRRICICFHSQTNQSTSKNSNNNMPYILYKSVRIELEAKDICTHM